MQEETKAGWCEEQSFRNNLKNYNYMHGTLICDIPINRFAFEGQSE